MYRSQVGRYIKQAREELGLSQEELGRMYGASGAAISQFESDTRVTRLDTLQKLAELLGKPLSYFLPGERIAETKNAKELLRDLEAVIESYETATIPIHGTLSQGEVRYQERDAAQVVRVLKESVSGARNPYALRVVKGNIGRHIKNEDIVIVDPDAPLVSGRIYVLKIGDKMSIHRVFRQAGRLRLKSVGGDVEAVDTSDIQFMGRVILTGRWIKL